MAQRHPHPASTISLSPPQMRLPFTPPPQRDLDVKDMAICASPATASASPAHRKRRKAHEPESLGAMLRRGIVEHQLGLSVNLMLLVGLSYIFFPSLRQKMSAFFWMSYPSESGNGMYAPGPRDLYLVASFVVVFTAIRAFVLEYLLMPLAGWCGIARQRGRVRFAEQSYMMLYYLIYWCWGVALFVRNTPSGVNDVRSLLISLWTGFPQLWLGPGMKLYYLSQLAFWIQQIVVIHIEERRKDHAQMLTHHIITVTLLVGSYPYRQWRVGNAVLVCMDLVDFVFPLAKILRYLALQTACDATFALFVILWLVSRHIFYLAICWSIYAHVNTVTMHYGTYSTLTGALLAPDAGRNILDNLLQPFLHPDAQTVAFNSRIRWLFLGLLLALQLITIAWFVMICRVVMRVLRGEGADDSRSDDEDSGEDISADSSPIREPPAQPSEPLRAFPDTEKAATSPSPQQPRFIEVESTSEEVNSFLPRRVGSFTGGSTGSKRKAKGISSGLNLNGHKDILNRIGCLSEEQLAREREKRDGGGGGGSARGSGSGS